MFRWLSRLMPAGPTDASHAGFIAQAGTNYYYITNNLITLPATDSQSSTNANNRERRYGDLLYAEHAYSDTGGRGHGRRI